MDGALRRDAIVAETVLGTTPATPGFKNLRTIQVDGDPERPFSRSPERVNHGQAANMVDGNYRFRKTFRLPFARDAGTDILWSSLLFGTWATDVLKNGQTESGFTYELRHKGTASDVYRRYPGMQCDSLRISFQNDGQPGVMEFAASARNEVVATTAITGATYGDPAPGLDPVTAADVAVTNIFGIATPSVTQLSLEITNSLRERYGFGSRLPSSHGRGQFNVAGSVGFYFNAATNYSAYMTRQKDQAASFLIGPTTLFKDQIDIAKADVAGPSIPDAPQADDIVMLNFIAKYDGVSTSSIALTRNVA